MSDSSTSSKFLSCLRSLFEALINLEEINEKYYPEEQELVQNIEASQGEYDAVKRELSSMNSKENYLRQSHASSEEMLKKSE